MRIALPLAAEPGLRLRHAARLHAARYVLQVVCCAQRSSACGSVGWTAARSARRIGGWAHGRLRLHAVSSQRPEPLGSVLGPH